MALLGAQLVITLVVISFIQKLGSHFSVAKWLLCSTGLIRFLHPTDEELKQALSTTKEKSKKRNRYSDNNKTKETFHVPHDINVQLESTKVEPQDVIHLRFYTEYQWLVDFSLYATVVYLLTEMYLFWFPLKGEMNLSIMWCSLVVIFAFKLMVSLTVQYFKGDESIGERSLCIVMGFTYFLISMFVLIIDEEILELNLDTAYSSFSQNAAAYLKEQGLSSSGPASKLILKFFLAIWCGLMGAFFTFPGMRMAKMHWDLVKCWSENKVVQILLNFNFAMPFVLILLWVRPVSRDYLTVRIFSGMDKPLMSVGVFESARIVLFITVILVRLMLMPKYLQAYLNMAYNRMEQQRKEAGRTTNVELQRRIASVFYYLCVVALQYVAPLVICLFFVLMYKTLGGYSWSALIIQPGLHIEPQVSECPATPDHQLPSSFTKSTQQIQFAIESLKGIFTEDVFRGLFGFATWWSCFSLFASTSIGMIYQTYFTHS